MSYNNGSAGGYGHQHVVGGGGVGPSSSSSTIMSDRNAGGAKMVDHCHSFCPSSIATYATYNLNTATKVINHVLAIQLLCDVCLFFSSWTLSFLPNGAVTMNVVMVSILLGIQTIFVYRMVNNKRNSAFGGSNTEFSIGLALGMVIGGATLAYVVSMTFRRYHRHCEHMLEEMEKATGNEPSMRRDLMLLGSRFLEGTPYNETAAEEEKEEEEKEAEEGGNEDIVLYIEEEVIAAEDLVCSGMPAGQGLKPLHPKKVLAKMRHVTFWTSFIFWTNLCCALLIARKRQDLTEQQYLYENIRHHQQQQPPGGDPSTMSAGVGGMGGGGGSVVSGGGASMFSRGGISNMIGASVPAFVGDYATIPEVLGGAGGAGNGSQAAVSYGAGSGSQAAAASNGEESHPLQQPSDQSSAANVLSV